MQASLKQIRQGRLPGLAWLVNLLDDAVHVAGLRVASDLMLMRKSLHTLEGVVAEIGDGAVELDDVLMNDFLRNLAGTAATAMSRRPGSRDFATRISNLDLMHLWLSGPTTVARYWLGSTSTCWTLFGQPVNCTIRRLRPLCTPKEPCTMSRVVRSYGTGAQRWASEPHGHADGDGGHGRRPAKISTRPATGASSVGAAPLLTPVFAF